MNVFRFIHETGWDDLPPAVQKQARRCLLDTLGTALAGRQTALSAILYDFAAAAFGGAGALLWLDGRELSPPGAVLAHAATIDALDIHDGYNLTKGHTGVAVIPAALATLRQGAQTVTGRELLATVAVGYEIATRAGVALHATAADYHTSGAWNALGAAAVTARRLGLDGARTAHALGAAEYHGPRSPMMRCIDHPTMVKDGSGWGAMAGVSAALLAAAGFTGAPADTVATEKTREFWDDLGQRWRILEQYFKPHAICRWAQPAVEGTLALRREHGIGPADVARIRIHTFHEAGRLAVRRPVDSQAAQYSLPFPVAAAFVHDRLGPGQLSGAALEDEQVLALADRVEIVEEADYSRRFPAERIARVEIETTAGAFLASGPVEAAWGAEAPPTDEELLEKFGWLARESVGVARARALQEVIWNCANLPDAARLEEMLAPPPRRAPIDEPGEAGRGQEEEKAGV